MKLMKHITIALVLCAIPAMAFGQVADCEDCEHQLPIYVGAAGFAATATGDMVNWRSTCGNTTKTGSLMPGDEGLVAALLDERGLNVACSDEDGTFELGPIMDGGWFWMHMGDNSAVGNIVAMDILDNTPTEITDSGNVTMMPGAGATVLVDDMGNFGILPTILPVAEMDPPETNTCSYGGAGTTASPYVREDSNCMLGNGGTMIRAQGPTDVFTGMRSDIAPGGTVTRPATGDLTVTVDLWGNGTGHFVTTYDAAENGANARLGHPGGVPLANTLSAMLGAVGPNAGTAIESDAAASAGLTFAHDGTSNVGTLTMTQHASYCAPTATPPVNYSAEVTFTATLDATQKTQVTPTIGTAPAAAGAAAQFKLTVVCPSASAAQPGVELVPENPFPVN
ncbi:MAG: hypothetical protein F4112_11550 [Holophagales bacterium]|nr:hypothetical protein [Holophagales bacterium]MYD23414.1 hypothetical protein [Holophagales bacterium]MYI33589.1 hypothetical protein [Holophagales bacterium]